MKVRPAAPGRKPHVLHSAGTIRTKEHRATNPNDHNTITLLHSMTGGARSVLVLSTILLLASCADLGGFLPPDISIERLQAFPDSVAFHGRIFTLEADLWRAYEAGPDSPPGEEPLRGILYIAAADSAPLPAAVSVDAVWLVNVDEVWRTWLGAGGIPDNLRLPHRLVRSFTGGPSWGPAIAVDVIVRLVDADGGSAFLRAEGQWISDPI